MGAALSTRAQAGQVGAREFLDLVLEEELGVRAGRRFHQARPLAGRPYHKPLDGCAFPPDLAEVRVKALATLRFVEHQGKAICLGPPGPGKTPVAVARAACPRGCSIDFTTRADLVQPRPPAESRQPWQQTLQPAWCGLDEVGYRPLHRVEAHDLLQVIGRRYERGSVLVTRNTAWAAGAALLGDDVLAAASLDPLLHHAAVLAIHEPSDRLQDRLPIGRAGRMARPS
jgi:DNA replication protein DnaC